MTHHHPHPAQPHAHSPTPHAHRERSASAWIVTVSDTRTLETDESGALVAGLLESRGHRVLRRVLVRDETDQIAAAMEEAERAPDLQVVILTGGTGVARRDVTAETVEARLARRIPGFGELFRSISFHQIGSAAMLSRATAGITAAGKLVFALPGSAGGCRTALESLILPELSHLLGELEKEKGAP